MKMISDALKYLFRNPVTPKNMADLLTLTLVDGTILRYTNCDMNLPWMGFAHTAANFKRDLITWTNDLSVDTLTITVSPSGLGQVKGMPFLKAIPKGIFDGATVRLERAFINPLTSPSQLFPGCPATVGIPIYGDWNGDGNIGIGIFDPTGLSSSLFYLDSNENGVYLATDSHGNFGQALDIPIVGKWTSDGKSKVGVWRPSNQTFYLDNNGDMTFAGADVSFAGGIAGDIPLVGDWNADGKSEVGFYRPSTVTYYLNLNGDHTTWTPYNWLTLPRTFAVNVFPPAYTPVAGTIILFYGRTGEITGDRITASIPVNSHLELLNLQSPPLTYQAQCMRNLYDISCGVNVGSYYFTGTVNGTATSSVIPISRHDGAGFYRGGAIKFTSGANNGLERTISDYDGNYVAVFDPFPVAPANGDTIGLVAGCDKTMQTCIGRFNNLANFRGQPFVPQIEQAV